MGSLRPKQLDFFKVRPALGISRDESHRPEDIHNDLVVEIGFLIPMCPERSAHVVSIRRATKSAIGNFYLADGPSLPKLPRSSCS